MGKRMNTRSPSTRARCTNANVLIGPLLKASPLAGFLMPPIPATLESKALEEQRLITRSHTIYCVGDPQKPQHLVVASNEESMAIQISEKTKQTICQTLDAASLDELQERPYQSLSVDADVNRDHAAIYAHRNRGSVRLNAGRYFTMKEYEDFVRQAKSVRLP